MLAVLAPLAAVAQAAPKVGPAHGTVIVVGGGNWGPEVYQAFIAAAGGPDALILDVPNAEGGASYTDANAPEARLWRQNGANNVHVLFTTDRKLADSDSFVAMIAHAGGVWFEGGRQFHLVDAYAGTKTEAAFDSVLARGGVVGGSSAGASILGDFLIRGAPSNDNMIMDYPGYEKGFAFLRGVGIDQHVVARERLSDLADSILPKYPKLLGISGDEGTAWVIHGDSARIIGRNKAFVYGGHDPTDSGAPFLTLHPGDRYNLATRRVTHRAIDDSPVSMAFITSMFKAYETPAAGGATVLVARNGEVLIDRSFGIPPQPKYMPTTAVPQLDVGGIAAVYTALCNQLPPPAARGRGRGTPADTTAAGRGGRAGAPPDSAAAARAGGAGGGRGRQGNGPPRTALQTCVSGRLATPIGLHRTAATADGHIQSSVDEMYRLALGLDAPTTYPNVDYTQGWTADTRNGVARLTAYGTERGTRAAFVRVPDRHATIIILTNDDAADARGMADRIFDKLMSGSRGF
ncbi:MAG TPA: Type 1 glutamine amidotransferase-like domain-containing protein [Gemmatimonadaceae bacterium]|nr:Type 1 glutamine amidotransferase-like domain-containing protein [Gemmatimonadaceae bacterium]